jgi:hypothetical protein
MCGTFVRGMLLLAGLAGTLMLGLWADAAPRLQEEFSPPKPTPEHLALKEEAGAWDAVIKASFPGPDGKVQEVESRGIEFNRMMPGDLWLITTFRGEFGGMPFHGHGVTGYDPNKKKYIGTWVDNFAPALMVMEGTYDEATKTSTFYSDTVDERGQPTKAKMTELQQDKDHRHFTLFMQGPQGGDDWTKVMEIHYTRREGPPPPEFGKGARKEGFEKRRFEPGKKKADGDFPKKALDR